MLFDKVEEKKRLEKAIDVINHISSIDINSYYKVKDVGDAFGTAVACIEHVIKMYDEAIKMEDDLK